MRKNSFKFILIYLLQLVLLFCSMQPGVRAQEVDVDELKFKKNQLQEKLATLNKQINTYQGQIDTTRKQAASLKNEVFLFDTQIKSTELQIQAKETQIEDTNLQIGELQRQIDRRKSEIEDNKNVLRQLLLELHQTDNNSFIQLALGTADFSNFLDQLQYANTVQDKVYQIVQSIKSVKNKLETQQADLRVELKKQQDLQDQLKLTQGNLTQQRQDKQRLLDKTKGVEKTYQKLLNSSQADQASLEAEINDLDDQVRKKLGDRTIRPNKGSLAMPMDGVLTQGYGNTGFKSLGYSFHNGWDIAAPAGEPIYSAADGQVTNCGSGEAAYGNWCTIKHTIATAGGNRCVVTLYGHMQSYRVKAGQSLKQGDLIGYEGNTGNTTRLLYGPHRGYHLHFTVFDCEGFGISQGKYSKAYGTYSVPYGYTYDPGTFLK